MATGENQEARGKGNCSFPGLAVHLLKMGTMPGLVQVRPEEAQGGVLPLLKLGRRVAGRGWAATRWWGQGQGCACRRWSWPGLREKGIENPLPNSVLTTRCPGGTESRAWQVTELARQKFGKTGPLSPGPCVGV